METSCLQYRLTDDERRTFEETGLLIAEDALSASQIAALTAKTDEIYAEKGGYRA